MTAEQAKRATVARYRNRKSYSPQVLDYRKMAVWVTLIAASWVIAIGLFFAAWIVVSHA